MFKDFIDDNFVDMELEESNSNLYSTSDMLLESVEDHIFQDIDYIHKLMEKEDIDPSLRYFLSQEYFFLGDTDEEFKEGIKDYKTYKALSDLNRLEVSNEVAGFITRSARGIGTGVKEAWKKNLSKPKEVKEKVSLISKAAGTVKGFFNFLIMAITGAEKNSKGRWGIFTLLGLASFIFMGKEIIKFTRSVVRSKKNVEKLDKVFKVYAQDIDQMNYDANKANKLTMTSLRENILIRHIDTSLNIQNLKQVLTPDDPKPINNEAEYNNRINKMRAEIKPYTDMYGITIEKNKIVMNKSLIKDIPETNRITSLGYGPDSIKNLSQKGKELLLKLNREVGGDMESFIKKHDSALQEAEKISNDNQETNEVGSKMSKKNAKKIIDYNTKSTRLGFHLYCRLAQLIFRNTLHMTANTIKNIYKVYG